MTAYWKDKKLSAEHRQKLSASRRGKYVPEERRKRISVALKGRNTWSKGHRLSDTTKQRMSASRVGHPVSEATRKKLADARKGFQHTEVTKAKIARTSQGRPAWNKGQKTGPLPEIVRRKMSAAHSGARHYNWKGGITPEIMRIRRSLETREWRKAVFERDNYICQMCKSRGGTLHADHISLFSTHPHLRFAVSNGRTLCKPCHNVRHSKQKD